ncbi:MAG TPA: nucleotidyltransferase domain-containing protein [Thermomicrobiales bacterium]|nr:nucleotidyltransferase domain-containing protein [Thermomicrobiales bacterium]
MSMERFVEAWTERLRREIQGAVAIILKGSHARGSAGPWSDLDFDVLVFDEDIADRYLSRIEENDEGRLVHVSVAVESVEGWLEGFDEAASWSFRLPSREATRLLWLGRPSLAAELDQPFRHHPAGEPELEDFIEGLGKARNAHRRGDELTLRLAVQDLASLCPSLLVPLNDPLLAIPGTRPESLRAALDFAIAPAGYRDDLLLCLGLTGLPSTPDTLMAAAERLVSGTLGLLEANADRLGPLLAPELPEQLSAGVLRRYLEQPTAQPD